MIIVIIVVENVVVVVAAAAAAATALLLNVVVALIIIIVVVVVVVVVFPHAVRLWNERARVEINTDRNRQEDCGLHTTGGVHDEDDVCWLQSATCVEDRKRTGTHVHRYVEGPWV